MMRRKRPLGATCAGSIWFGVVSSVGLGPVGGAMLLFRTQVEPVLRGTLPWVSRRRGLHRYDPNTDWLWPAILIPLAVVSVGLTISWVVRRPTENRAMDRTIRAARREAVGGAALEPERQDGGARIR